MENFGKAPKSGIELSNAVNVKDEAYIGIINAINISEESYKITNDASQQVSLNNACLEILPNAADIETENIGNESDATAEIKQVPNTNSENVNNPELATPEEDNASAAIETVSNLNSKEPNPEENSNAFNLSRQLVADYSSGSSEESSEDSSSDSESSDAVSELIIESSSESDLDELIQPVEELKISVPKEETKEIGFVKHYVENLVVVETKGGPVLDLGTVLFLDEGQRALGRVDDVFGPVTDPLYSVLFNSDNDIKAKGITPGMKVYYAPKTDHTSFAPVAELMRLKGSDASWKHNKEAPLECQDFSDDEEEARARGAIPSNNDSRRPTKRNWQQRKGNGNRNRPARSPQSFNNRERNAGTSNDQFKMPQYPPPTQSNSPHFSRPFIGPRFNYSQSQPHNPHPLLPPFNPTLPPPMPLGYSQSTMLPPPMVQNHPMCNVPPPMFNAMSHNIPPPPMNGMPSSPLFNTHPPPPPPSSSVMYQRHA